MGRPLIYICLITIVLLGIIQINLNDRHTSLIARSATYSYESQMRNMAHSGVELTLNRLRTNPTWRNGYEPYPVPLDYGTAYVEIQDNSTNPALAEDELRLISKVTLQDNIVEVAYLVEMVTGKVPQIPGALALTDPKFLTDLSGSYAVNGFDEAIENSETDSIGIPGITVMDQESKEEILNSSTEQELDQITGNTVENPSIEVDPTMDYGSLSQLIDQIEPNSIKLTEDISGNDYIGTQDNPGIFFVEDQIAVRGTVEGYGIMVVKESGSVDLSELEINGNFNFHGLVLFRNSLRFVGKGDAFIHGTAVIGSPDVETQIDIDLTGNLTIRYNSVALEYAKIAVEQGTPASFVIKNVYE